jgi:leucyl aminopeptidase
MAGPGKLAFGPFAAPSKGVLIVFTDEELRLGAATRGLLGSARELLARVARAERFTGKSGSSLDIVAPAGLKVSRLVAIGIGKGDLKARDAVKLGGVAMGKIPGSSPEATIVADLPGGPMRPEQAADVALGATLRGYAFERYKTKRREGEEPPAKANVTVGVADVAAARRAWRRQGALADGVVIARDLVNEPANVLYP